MPINPKLYRVIVPVNDIEKAAKFYGELFDTPGKRVSPGRHYFDCQGTIMACYDPKADGDDYEFINNVNYIYFSVEDLDSVYQKAKGLGFINIEDEIRVRPWGERSFYAADPFCNPVCFVDAKTVFTG